MIQKAQKPNMCGVYTSGALHCGVSMPAFATEPVNITVPPVITVFFVWCCACPQVYESCEALFCALADETQKYNDWLALGDTGRRTDTLHAQVLKRQLHFLPNII